MAWRCSASRRQDPGPFWSARSRRAFLSQPAAVPAQVKLHDQRGPIRNTASGELLKRPLAPAPSTAPMTAHEYGGTVRLRGTRTMELRAIPVATRGRKPHPHIARKQTLGHAQNNKTTTPHEA
jgi:hypothetical protein